MSEEKFSKCEKGKKNVSVEFRVFRKKMEVERKVPEKKIKVFSLDENLKWKILLSSYSLVGLYVSLQVKVAEEKKWWKFSKYFSGGFFKVKVAICWER